jgi:hypothetical protein
VSNRPPKPGRVWVGRGQRFCEIFGLWPGLLKSLNGAGRHRLAQRVPVGLTVPAGYCCEPVSVYHVGIDGMHIFITVCFNFSYSLFIMFLYLACLISDPEDLYSLNQNHNILSVSSLCHKTLSVKLSPCNPVPFNISGHQRADSQAFSLLQVSLSMIPRL